MHARHRNPANGYRSNPIGIGGGGGGGGGVAVGGPGYRNYNRSGFGRSQPKIFQSGPPPSPPPRRVDVFMEAGKLATEYLVSKGLLPPNSLNGKWQNSNLKNQIGGGDDAPDGVSGTGGGRRRFPDDYGGTRDGMRARRTMGSFKNPGFEPNREINRTASWSEKVKGSSNKQGNDDAFSGSMEELRSGKDGVGEEQKSVSGDLESKSYDSGNLEMANENKQNQLPDDNVGMKAPSSDVSQEGRVESAERSDCSKNLNMSTEEVNGESEKPTVTEDTTQENSTEENNNNAANKSGSDLLTLIRFNKVPTRTRSSVTHKGSKNDSVLIAGDEKRNESQNSGEPVGSLQLVSKADAPSDENQGLNHELNIKEAASAEEVAQLDHKYKFGQGLCTRSQSFPQISSITEQELGEGQPAYNRCSSAVLGRGEKRPLHLIDSGEGEGAKKPRDWASSSALADDYLHLSNSRGDQQSTQEGRSVITEPCNAYAEEKQLFPGSFKICDLNLIEASDVNENHDTNSVIGFPSIRQPKQEPVSVGFDLSISSSCDITGSHTRRGADGKEVEVIDLDCNSVHNDKVFNNSERKDETIFTDLESFPDSMQRVSQMPQDGYGLMISELLEADIPSSTVPTGVDSMHNEIGLRNEEGILGDDESIYMSLGEIPISFVPVWDQQPSQRYDKRY